MKKLCLECCKKTEVIKENIKEKAVYHNKEVTYQAEIYKCSICDNEIPSNELFDKNLDSSIAAYQKQFNMLTSNDFKYIRETIYDVSVRTMAILVGCSPATISKYENGALQSKQHDLQFKQLLSPKNMINLYEASKDELKPSDQVKLNERLSFLLEAVKVDELLKGLEHHLELPTICNKKEFETITVEQLENYFILKGHIDSNNEDDMDFRVSNLKLQKLMYYAEGWYSAIIGTDLILSNFEAWQHGPVIKSTYHKYKGYGAQPIDKLDEIETIEELGLTPNHLILLNWVWEKYSHFDAKYLEYLTHNEAPWVKTRGDLDPEEKCNWIINKEDIKSYFRNIYENLIILDRKIKSFEVLN